MLQAILQFYLIVFVPFIVEIVVGCFILTKKKTNFRFKPYISIPISFVATFGISFLITLGLGLELYTWSVVVNILSYTIMVLLVFGSLMFIYKIDVREAILIVAMAHTFEHISYQMSIVCLDTGISEILYKNNDLQVASNIYQALSFVIKIIFIVACAFTIGRFFLKLQKRQVSLVMSLVFVAVIFLVVIVVNVLVVQRVYMVDKLTKAAVALTFVTVCVLFDSFVIILLRTNEAERDLLIVKNTMESKYQQFEIMDKNINYINMKCHDLRKQLRLMNSKKEQLTDEDFKLLIDSLNFFDTDVKTGSSNIDSFIQERILYCKSLGIDFTSLVDGKGFGKMSPSDSYFLLLNIVDNAIDAARQVTKDDEKVISLTAYEKQGVLIIEETNYFVGKLDIKPDGTIKSKREGSDFHGYGTKSIAYIVNKYDGKVEYSVDKNIFKLKVVI